MHYVRAFAKPPSDMEPDTDTVSCVTPVFGVETDAVVEIVVGTLDDTQRVVRGAPKYTFFGVCNHRLPLSFLSSPLSFLQCSPTVLLSPQLRPP